MNLKSLTQPELAEILKELGQPPFRAKQVFACLLYTSPSPRD